MAQSLDIYIDTTNGSLISRGAARLGVLPILTRSDSYNLRLRLQDRDISGFARDLDTTGSSVKFGIGKIDSGPTDGQFKLTLNGVTSTAISFNATPTQVYNAISAIASAGVGVTTYGVDDYSYIITSATANTAMSFGGDSFTLFPATSVFVSTRRFPASSVAAQQVIRLVRNPAVYSDTFVTSSTANVVCLSLVQNGSSTQNETYDLAVGTDAEGGSIVLNYGTNSTTAIPIGATAASFTEALTSITAIGVGNISVEAGNNSGNYSISFVRGLGLTNITTALTVDTSGVIFGNFLETTVTMATSELDDLFAETGEDTLTPKLEVSLTQNGTPKTILQTDVTVRRDLITSGSSVPASQSTYLTAAESYATFIRNWGSTVTAQSSNINVVSALINVGLVANGATYGVFPQTVETLTLLTSVTFGTVNANDQHYREVVVTGAAVNDIVLVGLPSAISAGAVIQGVVYKANTVCLSCTNADNSSIAVNTATYRITVIGY